MINATTAFNLAETVSSGGTPTNLPSTERQGNMLFDEANLSVIFASMSGRTQTYISVGNYSTSMVDNCIAVLEDLGYNVDTSRRRSYGELVIKWGE